MGTKEEELRAELREEIARAVFSKVVMRPDVQDFDDFKQAGVVGIYLEAADAVMPILLRTAEQAWDEGAVHGRATSNESRTHLRTDNPYRVSVEGNK